MKKAFANIVTSVLTAAALCISVNITAVADDTLTPFETRYDLTSNHLVVDDLNFDGVKEIKTQAEWEEYVKSCVDRGYHYVFFKDTSGLTFDLNTFMNKNDITYAVTYAITRSGKAYKGYEFTYTYSRDILNAVKYGKESSLSTKQQQALQDAKTFLAGLPEGISDYEKELAIHNYVCEKLTYTQDHSLENMTDCYGGLILGRGNCMAYTDSFNLLCGLAGFNTGRVSCMTDSGAHSLNYILIDGEYYFVDCTFDGGIEGEKGYGFFYFNLPYSIITKTHTFQYLPFEIKPGSDANGYYQHYGTYADSPDALTQIYKKLADASAGGEILFNTANGTASLVDLFHAYHPASTSKIAISTCTIGNYQILRFSLTN